MQDFPIDMFDERMRSNFTIRKYMSRKFFIEDLYEVLVDNKVMILNGEWHRGIGKSSIMGALAQEYNIPIIVSTNAQGKMLKERFPKLSYYYVNQIDKSCFTGVFLVDCNIYDLQKLKENNSYIDLVGIASSSSFYCTI